MIQIGIAKGQIARLEAELKEKANRLPREIQTAVNAVARKLASDAAKDLSKEMPLKQRTLKKIVKQKAKATPQQLRAIVRIGEGYNIPLKFFNAKQIKRGVTYKQSRNVKGKSILRDAFIVKRYGGNVFKRVSEGRGPLQKQLGPKPGDYFERLRIVEKARAKVEAELEKQIERRIRFLRLKAAGGLRGNQR